MKTVRLCNREREVTMDSSQDHAAAAVVAALSQNANMRITHEDGYAGQPENEVTMDKSQDHAAAAVAALSQHVNMRITHEDRDALQPKTRSDDGRWLNMPT